MLKVISSDYVGLKFEMEEALQKLSEQIRLLKNISTPEDLLKIEELKAQQKYYKLSKVLPLRVGNIIVNYKFYELFTKKLKHFTLDLTDVSFTIKYDNGWLELHDLSPHFHNFHHIPVAVIEDAS